MKHIQFLFILFSAVSMTACLDEYTENYTAYAPIYMSYEDLRSAVKSSSPREIEYPGKIYFKGETLFVIEKQKGIHVVDVSNASSPKNTHFIELPGCVDIAIRNSSLYADSYVDLVVMDISDLDRMKETMRLKYVFPYAVPPTERNLRIDHVDKQKGVVVDWKERKISKEMDQGHTVIYPERPWSWYENSNDYTAGFNGGGSTGTPSSGASFGTAGSMARFGLHGDYLYSVDNSAVYLFDVSNDKSPDFMGQPQYVGSGIETMFVYDNHMFFGTSNGMLVYSLANPQKMERVASYWHITSCDPVVVEDGYAYLTLRSGTGCRNESINRLDVLKLSEDYKITALVKSYDMVNPHGLGIDGNMLFVCDGDAGLKIYDATDKQQIASNRLAAFPDIRAFDVIPVNGYLFMIGADGFYLYDYSDLQQVKLAGKIPVKTP